MVITDVKSSYCRTLQTAQLGSGCYTPQPEFWRDPTMFDLKRLFSPDGACAAVLPGWRSRPQQLAMAEAVERRSPTTACFLAEAGTGTGKTLAYLIPALLSGGKVVISTGTKALQDQLFHRDLPAARRALKSPVKVALLKGRANYVCHHHLQRNLADGRFAHRDDAAWLTKIARFAETSSSGDRAEAEGIPEDATAWYYAISSRDTCLGSECDHYKDCFVMAARKAALDAEVVVVNHHLFFADLWLKDEGVAELLPACNTVILDEAHQLAETAAQFFGETLSTAQLLDLAGDTKRLAAVKAGDFPGIAPRRRRPRQGRARPAPGVPAEPGQSDGGGTHALRQMAGCAEGADRRRWRKWLSCWKPRPSATPT